MNRYNWLVHSLRPLGGPPSAEGDSHQAGSGETSRNGLSAVVGWLVVAIPAGVLLGICAWISVNRFGISAGISYAAALAVWVGFLVWRYRRG